MLNAGLFRSELDTDPKPDYTVTVIRRGTEKILRRRKQCFTERPNSQEQHTPKTERIPARISDL